jgi:hypothetical protein
MYHRYSPPFQPFRSPSIVKTLPFFSSLTEIAFSHLAKFWCFGGGSGEDTDQKQKAKSTVDFHG